MQTVDRIITAVVNKGIIQFNSRSTAHVRQWKDFTDELYEPIRGLLNSFRRVTQRPHAKLKDELKKMLLELHERAASKITRGEQPSIIENRGSTVYNQWLSALATVAQSARQKEQMTASMVNLEDGPGLVHPTIATTTPIHQNARPAVHPITATPAGAATPIQDAIGAPTAAGAPAGTGATIAFPNLAQDVHVRIRPGNQPPIRVINEQLNASTGTRSFIAGAPPPPSQRRRIAPRTNGGDSNITFSVAAPAVPTANAANGTAARNPTQRAPHRDAPNRRHLDSIDRIDNGNLTADRNMGRLSRILNSSNRAGVQTSQTLNNLGGFMTNLSNNPHMNNMHGAQLNTIIGDLLLQLRSEVTQQNGNGNRNGN